jgi:hypothetical protein
LKLWVTIANVTRFIDKEKRYIDITESNGELLNLFIYKDWSRRLWRKILQNFGQESVNHYRDIGVIGAFAKEPGK